MTQSVSFPIGPLVVILALVAGALALFVLLDPGEMTGDLVIISPHNETTRTEIGEAFARWHERKFGEPIRISWVDLGGTSTSRRFVQDQFKGLARPEEGIGIDLFFGGGEHTFTTFASQNLLEPYRLDPETEAQIPATLGHQPIRDAEYRWHGVVLSGFGLLYNRPVAERNHVPEPKGWKDLADPRLFSWAAGAEPRRSGSIAKIFSIILDSYGWDDGMSVLIRYGGNVRSFTEASSTIAKDVAFGDAMIGPVIDSYGYAQMTETGGRTRFILPLGETPITADPVGILKGAPHIVKAKRFVDFLLSQEGQRIWMLKAGAPGGPRKHTLGRMPVRRDLYDEHFGTPDCAVPLRPYTARLPERPKVAPIEFSVLSAYLAAVLIDARGELVDAWRRIKDLEPDHPAWQELTRPTATEAELVAISGDQWRDSRFSRRTARRWAADARERYRRAAQMAEAAP